MKHSSAALIEVQSTRPSPAPVNQALALATQSLRQELDGVAARLQQQIDALGDRVEAQLAAQALRSDDLNHELGELRLGTADQLDDLRHDVELGRQQLTAELAQLGARMEEGLLTRASFAAALRDLAERSQHGEAR